MGFASRSANISYQNYFSEKVQFDLNEDRESVTLLRHSASGKIHRKQTESQISFDTLSKNTYFVGILKWKTVWFSMVHLKIISKDLLSNCLWLLIKQVLWKKSFCFSHIPSFSAKSVRLLFSTQISQIWQK